jgi:apolipoprotein N-acyltransferase
VSGVWGGRGLAGRLGVVLALTGGLAAGLAHPPFGILPGLAGFALILIALDGANPDRPWRSAFLRGWAGGFGYFLVGTWWVGEAFLVDIETHGWQAPFAVILLPAGLALFWGAAGLAYRLLAPPGAARRVLVFAALWSVAEWLRGHVLTGFPWNLPGEAWKAGSAPSQAAAVIGAYGLTFVTLAIGAAPAVWAPSERRSSRLARMAAPAFAVLALAVLWGGGAWRLSQATGDQTALRLRIVQPDIPQEAKWTPDSFAAIVDRYVSMTAAPSAERADVVIWPESAIPAPANDLLAEGTWTRAAIADALSPGQTLLAGMYRIEEGRYFNSLAAVRRTPTGLEITATYDKHRLVPFGEYLPLEALMSRLGLKKLAGVGDSFSPGPAPAPISPLGVPTVQPLICYESLFPGFTGARGPRPAWIVNVSNDAWFGRTSGPWQHLNLASYRAIESGLPLVRATPTGVSAVIDSYGRMTASLGLGERGVIDSRLPAAIDPTPFLRWRNVPFWIFCVTGLACALGRRSRRLR